MKGYTITSELHNGLTRWAASFLMKSPTVSTHVSRGV